MIPTAEHKVKEESMSQSAAAPAAPQPHSTSKSQRVLACVLCQQRKIKCDRRFPCANCVRSHSQCVPAATLAPRQRRRRFPERELLDRLRHYESLLTLHNIDFDPLHKDRQTADKLSRNSTDPDPMCHSPGGERYGERPSSPSSTIKSDTTPEAKSFWQAVTAKFGESDDESDDSSTGGELHETAIKRAWNKFFQNDDHLLFGSRNTTTDTSVFQPSQAHIFRLWQIYLDNVNPLVKVTHTPSLQGRIIEAASDVANIPPTLAPLMFSIYCMAIISTEDDECVAMFGASQEDLKSRYQEGCKQALMNCSFLRSNDRECLTALFLYLLSFRPGTNPQALLPILALAIRIAQRMGIHSEATLAKCTPLEAELRRRLWWALVLFDSRMCEMADYKSALLIPTWDCKTPLNLSDFDLQADMKDSPTVQGRASEAVFVVVRSEIGETLRHCMFHLDFINPALKKTAKPPPVGAVPEGNSELVEMKRHLEEDYLQHCNPQNPLHFMTIWLTRGQIARTQLFEMFAKFTNSEAQYNVAARDAAIGYAMTMLDCDTRLMASELTRGYLWYVHQNFPFLAYLPIIQELRKRPCSELAVPAWAAIDENYSAHAMHFEQKENPFYLLLAKSVMSAWDPREALLRQQGMPYAIPSLVVDIRSKIPSRAQRDAQGGAGAGDSDSPMGFGVNRPQMPLPMGFGGPHMGFDMGEQIFGMDMPSDSPEPSLPPPEQSIMGIAGGPAFDAGQWDWPALPWNPQFVYEK